jgi:hypothetical protein
MNPEKDKVHVDQADLDHRLQAVEPAVSEPSWRPTRKWLAGLAGSVATVVASWIVTGNFDDVERGMVGTALVALVAAYFQPNQPTPAGVPEK